MENLVATRPRLDDQLEALAHAERRRLLAALVDEQPRSGAPIEIDEAENAKTREALVSMRHRHLPKLADRGFIEWDRENHRVTRGPNFDEIEPLVELLAERRDGRPSRQP